jgi:3-methylcrotonyl-CoA carboxylase alpha subunit/geranyl-CoA carboxylase alpha subunit
LRIPKIIAAARATGADAVHPGYGFLSEDPEFAQAVEDAGLTWIGPPPLAIRNLGNKARARQLAQARGVPCLPGYEGEDQSDARFVMEAERIGFPLMVKAAAGGGGRGMRLVGEPSQLPAALQGARSEAVAAFGSGELLLERALLRARHVEVQVFADMHGNCIHLGERDCSVQRRHQKIIEESPSPAVGHALRDRMGQCAVDLAGAAGYVGAGTVEFLLEAGEFYLIEMNTRLQVEHAVTEMVTGHDLVEWQLRVACGERLPCRQAEVAQHGHAIEVRLCAEDEHFTPHAGTVMHFQPPPPGDGWRGGTLRFDHAIFEGLQVTPWYDSMLGKLVARAATREEAVSYLATALDRLQLLGLPTNRRLLAACLRHPVFVAGQASIRFLQEHGDEIRARLDDEEFGAAPEAALSALLPRGAATALASPFVRPLRIRHRSSVLDVPLCEAEGIAAGQARAVQVGAGRWHVQAGAVDLFVDDASFDPPEAESGGAGQAELRAAFNGKVIAVHVVPGQRVAQGERLLVIEAMKLEHTLVAPRDAVVEAVHVDAGQQVTPPQVLLTFAAAA